MSAIPITVEDIIFLHSTAIELTGGTPGIINKGNLYACCDRISNIFFGMEQYGGLFQKAAALTECLIKWSPFADANKRAALQTVHLFLEINGWRFKPDKETVRITLDIAQCKTELMEIELWIQNCSFPK